MRAFLAAEIDEELKEKISDVQKQLMEADAPVKFVEPHNLHFTFKFFGEIDEEKSEEIVSAVETKIQKYSPFEIFIKVWGYFQIQGIFEYFGLEWKIQNHFQNYKWIWTKISQKWALRKKEATFLTLRWEGLEGLKIKMPFYPKLMN